MPLIALHLSTTSPVFFLLFYRQCFKFIIIIVVYVKVIFIFLHFVTWCHTYLLSYLFNPSHLLLTQLGTRLECTGCQRVTSISETHNALTVSIPEVYLQVPSTTNPDGTASHKYVHKVDIYLHVPMFSFNFIQYKICMAGMLRVTVLLCFYPQFVHEELEFCRLSGPDKNH